MTNNSGCSDTISYSPMECRQVFPRHDGIQITVSDLPFDKNLRVQFRFPKSKRSRIRNKWAKQNRNFRYEVGNFCADLGNGKMIVSSRMYKQLSKLPLAH